MTGLPSSYETDGRHHREADRQHQPPGDVTIGEGKCRADECRDQPDPPPDLQGRADRRRWDQDASPGLPSARGTGRGEQNGKSTGKRQPVIPLRSHERLIQAELPRPHEYVANDCQGDGNGDGGP